MPIDPLWAVVLALPHEAKALLPDLKIQAETRYHASKLYEGRYQDKPLLLLQTGMGPKNARRAVEFLLAHHPVTHVVITGYCGGLVPGLKTGSAIWATKLISQKSGLDPIEPHINGEDTLQSGLRDQGLDLHLGPLVEVAKPVLDLEGKQGLFRQFGAVGVDMESFSVLNALKEQKNIASLILRFVVDPLEENLVDTEAFMDEQSGLRPWKLLKETFRNPKLLIDLPQLDRLAKGARRQLKKALRFVLTQNPGPGA